jgi:hypothetical protein
MKKIIIPLLVCFFNMSGSALVSAVNCESSVCGNISASNFKSSEIKTSPKVDEQEDLIASLDEKLQKLDLARKVRKEGQESMQISLDPVTDVPQNSNRGMLSQIEKSGKIQAIEPYDHSGNNKNILKKNAYFGVKLPLASTKERK